MSRGREEEENRLVFMALQVQAKNALARSVDCNTSDIPQHLATLTSKLAALSIFFEHLASQSVEAPHSLNVCEQLLPLIGSVLRLAPETPEHRLHARGAALAAMSLAELLFELLIAQFAQPLGLARKDNLDIPSITLAFQTAGIFTAAARIRFAHNHPMPEGGRDEKQLLKALVESAGSFLMAAGALRESADCAFGAVVDERAPLVYPGSAVFQLLEKAVPHCTSKALERSVVVEGSEKRSGFWVFACALQHALKRILSARGRGVSPEPSEGWAVRCCAATLATLSGGSLAEALGLMGGVLSAVTDRLTELAESDVSSLLCEYLAFLSAVLGAVFRASTLETDIRAPVRKVISALTTGRAAVLYSKLLASSVLRVSFQTSCFLARFGTHGLPGWIPCTSLLKQPTLTMAAIRLVQAGPAAEVPRALLSKGRTELQPLLFEEARRFLGDTEHRLLRLRGLNLLVFLFFPSLTDATCGPLVEATLLARAGAIEHVHVRLLELFADLPGDILDYMCGAPALEDVGWAQIPFELPRFPIAHRLSFLGDNETLTNEVVKNAARLFITIASREPDLSGHLTRFFARGVSPLCGVVRTVERFIGIPAGSVARALSESPAASGALAPDETGFGTLTPDDAAVLTTLFDDSEQDGVKVSHVVWISALSKLFFDTSSLFFEEPLVTRETLASAERVEEADWQQRIEGLSSCVGFHLFEKQPFTTTYLRGIIYTDLLARQICTVLDATGLASGSLLEALFQPISDDARRLTQRIAASCSPLRDDAVQAPEMGSNSDRFDVARVDTHEKGATGSYRTAHWVDTSGLPASSDSMQTLTSVTGAPPEDRTMTSSELKPSATERADSFASDNNRRLEDTLSQMGESFAHFRISRTKNTSQPSVTRPTKPWRPAGSRVATKKLAPSPPSPVANDQRNAIELALRQFGLSSILEKSDTAQPASPGARADRRSITRIPCDAVTANLIGISEISPQPGEPPLPLRAAESTPRASQRVRMRQRIALRKMSMRLKAAEPAKDHRSFTPGAPSFAVISGMDDTHPPAPRTRDESPTKSVRHDELILPDFTVEDILEISRFACTGVGRRMPQLPCAALSRISFQFNRTFRDALEHASRLRLRLATLPLKEGFARRKELQNALEISTNVADFISRLVRVLSGSLLVLRKPPVARHASTCSATTVAVSVSAATHVAPSGKRVRHFEQDLWKEQLLAARHFDPESTLNAPTRMRPTKKAFVITEQSRQAATRAVFLFYHLCARMAGYGDASRGSNHASRAFGITDTDTRAAAAPPKPFPVSSGTLSLGQLMGILEGELIPRLAAPFTPVTCASLPLLTMERDWAFIEKEAEALMAAPPAGSLSAKLSSGTPPSRGSEEESSETKPPLPKVPGAMSKEATTSASESEPPFPPTPPPERPPPPPLSSSVPSSPHTPSSAPSPSPAPESPPSPSLSPSPSPSPPSMQPTPPAQRPNEADKLERPLLAADLKADSIPPPHAEEATEQNLFKAPAPIHAVPEPAAPSHEPRVHVAVPETHVSSEQPSDSPPARTVPPPRDSPVRGAGGSHVTHPSPPRSESPPHRPPSPPYREAPRISVRERLIQLRQRNEADTQRRAQPAPRPSEPRRASPAEPAQDAAPPHESPESSDHGGVVDVAPASLSALRSVFS
eukprot:gnl/Chilomastix_cuspidata/2290.p1 GENE.gnl/Chilomastix_cuspidata/2290~~gnl/Chilomastix_cuspidata/2290.p1  ORF type:complete len:1659 (-),score=194.08 gnl/Chilomastix_cuspidata/2290:61-5037(-)